MGFPPPMDPPPRIKYHNMVKVPHLWDFSPPPPPQKKSHMLSQYYIWNLCWRRYAIEGKVCHMALFPPGEVLPWEIFRGGGGGEGLSYGIIFPWGNSAMGFLPGIRFAIWNYFPHREVLLWDFFRGGSLPYGIPSWGTFAIWYNFRGDNLPWYLFPHHEICVGGFTIEGEALPYGISPPPPWGVLPWDLFHGRFAVWYSFRGNIWYNFGGGGGV